MFLDVSGSAEMTLKPPGMDMVMKAWHERSPRQVARNPGLPSESSGSLKAVKPGPYSCDFELIRVALRCW